MASPSRSTAHRKAAPVPTIFEEMPILYEDEEEGDMGEANPHVESDVILFVCLKAHLADRPEYRVFSNMNCYYLDGPRHPVTGSLPYISPDNMVVRPSRELGDEVESYTIGEDGPSPEFIAEVLSERSAQQRDLTDKVKLYALLGVGEYFLVDSTGRFLRQRLLLKRLQPDRTWKDVQDSDGGVTSRLGFRLIWDSDGRLRVIDAKTGKAYVRPDEAQLEADARRQAEERVRAESEARIQAEEKVRELQAELERVRTASEKKKSKKPSSKRRKKS